MTKQEALKKIEELKNYVADLDKKSKIQIKDRSGNILFESDKETVKEAVEEAINENANLTDANLTNADLSDAYLINANLTNANLINANLTNAYLGNANLSDADLSDAYLGNADLTDADLYHTRFYGKGGSTKINNNQVSDFLKALGVVVGD